MIERWLTTQPQLPEIALTDPRHAIGFAVDAASTVAAAWPANDAAQPEPLEGRTMNDSTNDVSARLGDLHAMWRIRALEEKIRDMRLNLDIVGSVHLANGQESIAVATCSELRSQRSRSTQPTAVTAGRSLAGCLRAI